MEPTAPQLRVPHGNGRKAAIGFFRAVALDLDGTLSVGTELHRVFPGLVGDVFGRDRADLGPAHAAARAAEDIERYGPKAPVRRRRVEPPTPRRPEEDFGYRSPASSQSRGIGF